MGVLGNQLHIEGENNELFIYFQSSINSSYSKPLKYLRNILILLRAGILRK